MDIFVKRSQDGKYRRLICLLTGTPLYVYAFSPFFQEHSSYDKVTYKFPSGVHPALARYSESTERLDRGSNNLSKRASSSN
ncbi:hypothetical protein DPMN_038564 [Dreissena polymorpha]|uniref:Uncharacterized protein n=1 Tax=Dreissena polymorpha TaxID=45954 RepID=A0A9D4MFI4_DREPO|nr:hypothetical protein DPMN_038564 [Dreissena polymorpha]